MPGFKDWVNLAVLTEADLDDYVGKQVVMKFATGAARDAALAAVLREGMLTWQDDSNAFTVYTGAGWSSIGPAHGVLSAWTPLIVQTVGVASTVSYATFQRIGRRVEAWFRVQITGTGTAGAVVTCSTPNAALAASVGVACGEGWITDASGPNRYKGTLQVAAANTVHFLSVGSIATADQLGVSGFTAALAVGDEVAGHFSFEAGGDG